MAGTLIGVAIFVQMTTGMGEVLGTALCGSAASVAKLVVMWRQRRHTGRALLDETETQRWERAHAVTTAVMAASVGATSAAIFLSPETRLHILAAGLVFGYCSGLIVRLGIRPWIAIPALYLATLPSVCALALQSDATRRILVVFMLVFLMGACESVRHIYQTAVRHVGTRLEMARLASRDPLTGLANRIGLREAFQAIPPDMPVAVLCLDLDGFKAINARYGHAAGDALLQGVAARLSSLVPQNATVVRMGGDEFAVLQPGPLRTETILELAQRISTGLREPFALETELVTIGASVGHAASAFKPATIESLLARADEESYRIKAARMAGEPQAALCGIA